MQTKDVRLLWFVFSFFLVGFFFLTTLIKERSNVPLDEWGLWIANNLKGTSLHVVLEWGGLLASKSVIIFLSLLTIFLLIFFKRDNIGAVMLFLFVMGGNVVNKLVKEWIGRERPNAGIEGYSYPSGHVMIGLIMYGLIIYLSFQYVHNSSKRKAMFISATVVMLLVGMSRILVLEHFVTDVLAGYCLGGAVLSLGVISDQFLRNKTTRKNLHI